MATLKRIVVPQDQQFVMANGYINPAWYRFLLAIQKQFPDLITLEEKADETKAGLASASDTIAALDGRVGSLERNFSKDPLTEVDVTTLTISAAYDQTEIQALETRVTDYGAVVNAIIDRLEQSNLVRTP